LQATTESLKFGSAAPSARNSGQGPVYGAGRGSGKAKQAAGRGASGRATGGGSDGEGDLSDVTQGSREDDDDGPRSRGLSYKPGSFLQGGSKPTTAVATGATNKLRAADSFYSVPTVEDDGSQTGSSGDSNQAHSPLSKSANSFSPPTDLHKGSTAAAVKSKAREDEEDEYSFDDFEQDANHSPEKPSHASKPSTLSSSAAVPAVSATAFLSEAYQPRLASSSSHSRLPPPELGLSSPPSQKTLTPTSSTASMHSGARGGSTGLTSVEEIMQRWHTADSDFMQRSLQRIGTGEAGFSLNDDEVRTAAVSCGYYHAYCISFRCR
jgi:hypothetical protein